MNALRFAPRILLLLGIVAAIVWAAVNRDRLDIEALDAWVAGFGLLAPLAYLALYAVGTVAFLPGAFKPNMTHALLTWVKDEIYLTEPQLQRYFVENYYNTGFDVMAQ